MTVRGTVHALAQHTRVHASSEVSSSPLRVLIHTLGAAEPSAFAHKFAAFVTLLERKLPTNLEKLMWCKKELDHFTLLQSQLPSSVSDYLRKQIHFICVSFIGAGSLTRAFQVFHL